MSKRNFREMLEAQWDKGNFVCVGLDSDIDEVLKRLNKGDYLETMCEFNRNIVETTRDLVCAFKLNTAFYENRGSKGWFVLEETIKNIHKLAPEVPVILDAKRADIGNSNAGYVCMAFDYLKADAITVHPYLGAEALKPFLERKEKGIIVLCHTSNLGAGEFQDKVITPSLNEAKSWGILWDSSDRGPSPCWEITKIPLYQYIAYRVSREWNKNSNCALVVGATYPWDLKSVRRIIGDMPILIPGIGFQQKNVPIEEQVKQVVNNGKDSRGQGMIINLSRSIIFASKGLDFAEAARRETKKLCDLINQYR